MTGGNKDRGSQSICWECAKACGRCSWSRLAQQKVQGSRIIWFKVKYRKLPGDAAYVDVGRVLKCPEFEEG